MIGLSTNTLDLETNIILNELENSDLNKFGRRVSVIKTLDGGVSVEDRGTSDIDNQIIIELEPTLNLKTQLKHLVQNYTEIGVSTLNGFYQCSPIFFDLNGKKIKLTLQRLN